MNLEFCPLLELYGAYTREEIFTLVGKQNEEVKMQGSASGAFHLNLNNASLLFVTLNKSDKDFSPSTQYKDYVINEYIKAARKDLRKAMGEYNYRINNGIEEMLGFYSRQIE